MSQASAIVAGAVLLAGLGAAFAWRRPPAWAAGPVIRTDHAFEFTARAPLRRAFPLFGAWGERVWAGPSWTPRFLYPDPPRDEAGEVFTLPHGTAEAVWVNTAFDADAGRIQYVYVLPEAQAVLIDLALEERDGGTETLVRVRYRRTALAAHHNAHVTKLGAQDAASAAEWEQSVNTALLAAAPPP